ncbi:putative protein YneK [Escherichia coli]|uniref:putative protein YneK n=1 Tax=Escherichia coli TaxID=562 RepID=UPI00396474BD
MMEKLIFFALQRIFIDALSTIICNEEWRTSLNINSATKKIFNNLDNLSYIQEVISRTMEWKTQRKY